ncbi:hypothetical protein [Fluviicola taffensis]|uniref:Lipoprotein n=1 Tax=Fluviicola taffensis (strain DSM 16823 / NCIMB 13979 / RW262) TaxID=755732 RepID=F2IDL8_FLUTR|nr:hypothetical protein [Fluviicola taffensis]AEA43391.1 hypothetical protein Fluta_1397 [Fluviicola taffensis DSM 16823]
MRIFLIGFLILALSSCVDIFDDITIHADGSGTYKYTINMSANKVKINSILALDSVDNRRVPKLPEIKEKIEFYRTKLGDKKGISNVKIDANYDDFIFKISCDFESISDLQEGIREIIKEESKEKNDPILNENWLTWDGKTLTRIVPNFQSFIHKLKTEDQESLKKGQYVSVSRFEKPILKCDNPQAQISPTKIAVLIKSSTFSVATNPSVLKNSIVVSY